MRNKLNLKTWVIISITVASLPARALAGSHIHAHDSNLPHVRFGGPAKTSTGSTMGAVGSKAKAGIIGAGVVASAGSAALGTTAFLGSSTAVSAGVAGAFVPATAAAVGATLGLTGAVTLGIVPAALAVGGIATFGAYKLYKKYKNHLMGVPSQVVVSLHKTAEQTGVPYKDVLERYLKKKLTKICKANGYPDGEVDLEQTKTEERKFNINRIPGTFLTAYNEAGVAQNYRYVKGFPSIIIRSLKCSDPKTDLVTNDTHLQELTIELEEEAAKKKAGEQKSLNQQRRIATRRDKNLREFGTFSPTRRTATSRSSH